MRRNMEHRPSPITRARVVNVLRNTVESGFERTQWLKIPDVLIPCSWYSDWASLWFCKMCIFKLCALKTERFGIAINGVRFVVVL